MHLGHDHAPHGFGHNGGAAAKQWQTPHLPPGARPEAAPQEPDLDLVETAFAVSFPSAPDPTSFLRLAGIPFVGETADGKRLSLLRVEINQTTDTGALTPHVGGQGHRYDPLPASMTSRRQSLHFVYYNGSAVRRLTLGEVRGLKDRTPPS